MKLAWKALVALGIIIVISAFSMDTTLDAGMGRRVHNIGLQGQQQMLLILGCVIFLAGIGVFGIAKLKQTPDEDARDRAAEEAVRQNAGKVAESAKDMLRGDEPRAQLNDRYTHLSTDECLSRISVRGYKVTVWFGKVWTVRAPDGKSLQIAFSVHDLRHVLADVELSIQKKEKDRNGTSHA